MTPSGGGPDGRGGVVLGLVAYVLWGLFPLYFPLLEPAGALEILCHRVLWSLLLCVVLVTGAHVWRGRGWQPVLALARAPRTLALLVLAATAIGVNWGVYILATNTGHVVEASLGYFINPLVTVALALTVLHERLRALQWAAVGVGAAAVVELCATGGRPPWISLLLAASFGTYGLVKKQLGSAAGGVDALSGLTAETLVLAVPAAVVLAVVEARGRGHFASGGAGHALLLASTGVVTAVPLLMFAGAARRVPLTTIGLLQYVTPVLQLLVGVLLLGEPVSTGRWVGLVGIWCALGLLSTDAVLAGRRASRAPRAAAPELV